ncbi:MAG: hypothetical protein ACREBM_09310, partial [Sphingomicrobium sp.]
FGAAAGAIAATIVFRARFVGLRRWAWLGGGILAALAASLLSSGPLGAGERFIARVEADARLALENYEMGQVKARLGRAPLTRKLYLSGRADDFQRSGLARILATVPGVSEARWTPAHRALPLVAESGLAALAGFLLGLFLAYLVELHRRYNAQWDW